jgi:urease accessory protein
MKLRSLAPVALLAASGLALAHPGHDTAPALGFFEGLVHLLTQPDHVAMLGSAIVVALAARRAWRARREAHRRARR